MSKLKWSNHIVLIGIQIISPPLEHQAALVKVFGFLGLSCTDTIAFLVAYLKLYSVF